LKLVSYNGVSFASLNLGAGLPDAAWSGQQNSALVLPRRGYNPAHIGLQRGTRSRFAELSVKPGGVTTVQVYAALVGYSGSNGNSVTLEFSVADPVWRKTTLDSFGPVSWTPTAPAMLSTPNAGKARANLNLVIKPTALAASGSTFKLRRTFTVTNNSDTPWYRFPLEINLGNTGGWTSTVSANADLTWIFQDGIAQPRELIGWSEAQTYVWILVNNLAPGATATYDIAWEGASASPKLTGANRVAFDMTWEKGNATAGSATTITKTGAGWTTNQWYSGQINILTGAGAGQVRFIASNTATVITATSAFSPAPDATSVFLLTMSHNPYWIYDVRQVSRSNLNRGLWYQNRGQTRPSVINFDVPGGWYRYLKVDNNDEKNQSRTFAVDVGGGDIDYFNGLDADRTAQAWSSLQEEGQADGVAFSSPIKILSWIFNYQFKNPNGICKAIFGFRENGAEDWESALEDGTAHDTLTAAGTTTATFTTDTRHLLAHLGPADEQVIPVSWIKDTGSVDGGGGGSSSLQDSTKAWATDQWKNGTVRIVSGRGVGQARTVTGNTSVLLSVSSAWTAPGPGNDSRFEVKNQKLIATLRHLDQWQVRLDTSAYTISAISAETNPNYVHNRDFRLGGGPDIITPYQRIQIGQGNRWVQLAGTQEIRVNGQSRRAGIYTTSSGALVRDITDAIQVRNYETDGNSYLAPEWLLVPPTPTTALSNPGFTGNTTGWLFNVASGGVTHTDTYDATVFHGTPGSLKIDITASTAGVGATVQWYSPTTLPTYLPVIPGKSYTATTWVQTSTLNWKAKIGIFWMTAAGASAGGTNFSSSADALATLATAGVFSEIGFTGIAPATAVFARIMLLAWQMTASSIGTVWFDDVQWNSTALFFPNSGGAVTEDVSATILPGFHG